MSKRKDPDEPPGPSACAEVEPHDPIATQSKGASPVLQPRKKSRQRRLVWTKDLHARFLAVVTVLGPTAKPKDVLHMMNVSGLTRQGVASHLQKYRLRLLRAERDEAQWIDFPTPLSLGVPISQPRQGPPPAPPSSSGYWRWIPASSRAIPQAIEVVPHAPSPFIASHATAPVYHPRPQYYPPIPHTSAPPSRYVAAPPGPTAAVQPPKGSGATYDDHAIDDLPHDG